MLDRSPEEQANGRFRLMLSAKLAREDGFSINEWMQHPDVLECVEDYELDECVLEHIGHFVWYPIQR